MIVDQSGVRFTPKGSAEMSHIAIPTTLSHASANHSTRSYQLHPQRKPKPVLLEPRPSQQRGSSVSGIFLHTLPEDSLYLV